jgi:ethanolamine transporter
MMKGFRTFARLIKIVAIFGLTVAAFTHLTGITVLKNLLPLQDAMKTVSAICIVMLGSMPLAELIQRIMNKPFAKICDKTGLNGATTTGILLGLVSATPALAMIPQMNRRGQVVGSACLVSCVCSFGAHFAYANSLYPEMVPAMLAAKLSGGLLGGMIAMFFTRNMQENNTR